MDQTIQTTQNEAAVRRPLILVVDDEQTLLDTLEYNLRREGYEVITAADGPAAIRLANDKRPDLIILDVMLPGQSGFDVCRAVRKQLTVPILMLSAREEEIDKVLGLELGADDYITKPFGLRELLARVRAMLRRAEMLEAVGKSQDIPAANPQPGAIAGTLIPGSATSGPTLESDDMIIDLNGRAVSIGGKTIALKPKEFDLLVFLTQHPGQVFSRDTLLNRVWGYDFVGGTRTVDVHVRWLRSKIEADEADPQFIQTVYGVGYKFGRQVNSKGS